MLYAHRSFAWLIQEMMRFIPSLKPFFKMLECISSPSMWFRSLNARTGRQGQADQELLAVIIEYSTTYLVLGLKLVGSEDVKIAARRLFRRDVGGDDLKGCRRVQAS